MRLIICEMRFFYVLDCELQSFAGLGPQGLAMLTLGMSGGNQQCQILACLCVPAILVHDHSLCLSCAFSQEQQNEMWSCFISETGSQPVRQATVGFVSNIVS